MGLLYGKNDMLFGKSLLIWGKKFSRNKNQNFIKIIGSSGCKIKTSVSDTNEIKIIKQENPEYNLYGDKEYTFDKRHRLICEPEKDSNCPDYKGVNKHYAKKHGHTPNKEYEVNNGKDFLCAVCYLDPDRQPRKPCISLRSIELKKSYSISTN